MRPVVRIALLLLVASPRLVPAAEVILDRAALGPPAQFAADEIAAALTQRGDTVRPTPEAPAAASLLIRFSRPRASDGPLPTEAFRIQRYTNGPATVLEIEASGAGGHLYGGLELAEQIRLKGLGAVVPFERAPHFALRGVKFNLPLDVRTPSYSDMSDAGQANIPTVWEFEFWREFLDNLARHRYNALTLWNLHPFPSLVKVPGYEDIALNDVQRSTAAFAEDYSTRADDIVTPAILANVETVRTLTIEEKIAFWRRVMAHARDRNIDVYFVTWNAYTYGTSGKYGITDAITNPRTTEYFRRSVAQLFRTYPLLRGIGVTAGENMGAANSSFQAKEDWLFATYGQGVLDAVRAEPGRKIRFIHRQHETRAADIAKTFAPLIEHPDVEFDFSFKYAQAHVLSSTRQTFHRDFVRDLGALKTLWTLRNDDALLLRWGAPDFVREFIRNMPREVTRGVYYGSDMWVWGREFLALQPDTPRQLEIAKHAYAWMLWGRLSYDPSFDNDRIVSLLAERFPTVEAAVLFDTWQHASMSYPLTTGFHWGEYDFQWYIEACRSRPEPARTKSGFHDVNRFITLRPHPATDNVSIPDWVEAVVTGRSVPGTTPLQVSARLHDHAAKALQGLERLAPGDDRELRRTLTDIRAMALLGDYYGHKIRGAASLALFRRLGRPEDQEQAISALTQAAAVWTAYSQLMRATYRSPIWTNRVGTVDWSELDREVTHDIAIARQGRQP